MEYYERHECNSNENVNAAYVELYVLMLCQRDVCNHEEFSLWNQIRGITFINRFVPYIFEHKELSRPTCHIFS